MALGPDTRIGAVRLAVADPVATRSYYETVIGLTTLDEEDGVAALGPPDREPLVELESHPGAPPRPGATTGLFHVAVLVPDRDELGRSLRRIAAAGERLTGASDHLVSEALYLRDPEGNGIEVYRDRPRAEWGRDESGEIRMATIPLDLDGVLAAGGGPDAKPPAHVAPAATIGHVHLNVADLAATESFYAGELGLDVTVRGYPGALFMSAGGYHHHVGANTWEGEGAPQPPAGSLGLVHFELVSGDAGEAEVLADPAGNGVLVRGPR